MPRGPKIAKVEPKKVSTTMPEDDFDDMVRIIETDRRWVDVADFVRQAVREKVDRWKREHPGTPASAEVVSAFGRRT